MIDWHAIDTVLLDMDGTLLDLHFDNHFWLHYLPKRYSEIHNTAEAEALDYLVNKIEAKRGTLEWYCLDYWSSELQLDIPQLKREIQHLIAIRPHVEVFLKQLQQRHQRVLLVTNAHEQSLQIKLDNTGIHRLLDQTLTSHQFGLPKEDPAFWGKLQDEVTFDPARTLLIDDTESVLASAEQFGIAHLLTVLQPDSKKAKRLDSRFPGIHHFDEITPE